MENMEIDEISLEEFIGHGLILKEQIDQDMIDLKQIGNEISILTTKMNDLHTSLSEKIQIKEEYDQTLCDWMSSSATDDTDGPEKQVKFSLPASRGQSGNINTGKSKVFSRSSSSAGVLSKQPQTSLKSSDSNASTSTSKSQPPHGSSLASKGNSSATSSSGLCNIQEDKQTEQEEVDDAVARAKAKRASMVKKALRYFEDKSNRSMSEDNLFTRRKNLAVHLGLDENVSLREIQKINTFSLPVPSSATPFNAATGSLGPREDEILKAYEEEIEGVTVKSSENTKDMIKFLGMKDPGFKRSTSMSPSHTP